MTFFLDIVLFLCAYFLGNLSPATILAKASGHDIKKEGSGNAGTTNVLRVVGKKAALITLIIDVGKGFVATKLGYLIPLQIYEYKNTGSPIIVYTAVVISGFCGLFVFMGHVWPILLNFKGGKGVATALGVLLATNWRIALICLGVFIVVVAISRMVSLGSLTAAFVFLILHIREILFKENMLPDDVHVNYHYYGIEAEFIPLLLPFVLMVIILFLKHKPNIKRIIKGEENKLSFKTKTDKEK